MDSLSSSNQRSPSHVSPVHGAMALAGGLGLGVLGSLARIPFVGLAIGIGLLIAGTRQLRQKSAHKRAMLQGAVLTALGIISVIAGLPWVGRLGIAVMGATSLGLIIWGIVTLLTYRRSSHRYN